MHQQDWVFQNLGQQTMVQINSAFHAFRGQFGYSPKYVYLGKSERKAIGHVAYIDAMQVVPVEYERWLKVGI